MQMQIELTEESRELLMRHFKERRNFCGKAVELFAGIVLGGASRTAPIDMKV